MALSSVSGGALFDGVPVTGASTIVLLTLKYGRLLGGSPSFLRMSSSFSLADGCFAEDSSDRGAEAEGADAGDTIRLFLRTTAAEGCPDGETLLAEGRCCDVFPYCLGEEGTSGVVRRAWRRPGGVAGRGTGSPEGSVEYVREKGVNRDGEHGGEDSGEELGKTQEKECQGTQGSNELRGPSQRVILTRTASRPYPRLPCRTDT